MALPAFTNILITGLWGCRLSRVVWFLHQVLISKLPFRHVHLKNKFGNLVPVHELRVR